MKQQDNNKTTKQKNKLPLKKSLNDRSQPEDEAVFFTPLSFGPGDIKHTCIQMTGNQSSISDISSQFNMGSQFNKLFFFFLNYYYYYYYYFFFFL